MEALILAAGLGTRLRPLTNDRPKALVEVGGRTLLETNIRRLTAAGATRIVVNVHHFADMICRFVAERQWDVPVVISDERALLLDTGGALRHAAPLFSGNAPILVHNVDILSSIDLNKMVEHHTHSMNIATLAASHRDTSRLLLFDHQGHLVGWTNRNNGETLWANKPLTAYDTLAFSGISVIDPSLPTLLPEADHPYPIIPEYLHLAATHTIGCYLHNPDQWIDVGKVEALEPAAKLIANQR
jgi:NDP-sugar pyrophosphorylase family protein